MSSQAMLLLLGHGAHFEQLWTPTLPPVPNPCPRERSETLPEGIGPCINGRAQRPEGAWQPSGTGWWALGQASREVWSKLHWPLESKGAGSQDRNPKCSPQALQDQHLPASPPRLKHDSHPPCAPTMLSFVQSLHDVLVPCSLTPLSPG